MTGLDPVLDIRDLTVTFRTSAGRVTAAREVTLSLAAGESVALVGGSGAGKSTVARAVAGLVPADRGQILLDGTDLLTLRRFEARVRRRALHLVFQDPYAALPPTLRVGDVVAEPLVIHRIGDREQRQDRVREAMAAVRLPERFRDRYVHQLSGGERQRVALARALTTRPRLLLADEPTAMLDASLRRELVDLLAELATDRGMAVLHITHDLALAQRGCARLVVMRAGRIVEHGRTEQVLGDPLHEYTKALVAACRGRVRREPEPSR
ncbi:MAG: ABC transporter ATP-binding protein [Sporichthyaceae bacterium]